MVYSINEDRTEITVTPDIGEKHGVSASFSNELLCCPFCGSENISSNEILGQHKDGNIFGQTVCEDCGACGPEVLRLDNDANDSFQRRVDEEWNARHTA